MLTLKELKNYRNSVFLVYNCLQINSLAVYTAVTGLNMRLARETQKRFAERILSWNPDHCYA